MLTNSMPTNAWVSSPAQAADYEVGASLLCDTQSQKECLVALFSGDAQAASDTVNAEEHDLPAYALVNVAYLRGSHIAGPQTATTPLRSYVSRWLALRPPPEFRRSSPPHISPCLRNTQCKAD
jgi:hypothetical protein